MNRSTTFAAILLVTLAACGDVDDDVEAGVASPDSVEIEPAAAPPLSMDQAASGMGDTAQMQPLGESGVGGEATVTERNGETEVLVRLTGSTAANTHPGHIHTGSCSDIGGVVEPLDPITVDTNGTGTMTTRVPIPASTVMDGQHIVVYHGEGGTPITCAAIPQHTM